MRVKSEEIGGKSRIIISDEVKEFFRMGDERDYKAKLVIDGTEYYFTALKTDCPFAKVSLKLYENTNKRTIFDLIIDFDRSVTYSL